MTSPAYDENDDYDDGCTLIAGVLYGPDGWEVDEPEPELHDNPAGPDATYQVHINEIRFAQWGPDCKGSQTYEGTTVKPDSAVCGRCQQTVRVDSAGYTLIHTVAGKAKP